MCMAAILYFRFENMKPYVGVPIRLRMVFVKLLSKASIALDGIWKVFIECKQINLRVIYCKFTKNLADKSDQS